MTAPSPPTATPRARRALAGLAAAVALLGVGCTVDSGGGDNSTSGIIDTLTDEDLPDPLTPTDAGCAAEQLRAQLTDEQLGDMTRGADVDDPDLVEQVGRIIDLCRAGAGPAAPG